MTATARDRREGVILLTPVTPVHIGTGQNYTAIDYDIRNGFFEVKDVRAFFEANIDNPQYAVDAVEQGLKLGPEFIRYRLPWYGDDRPTAQRPGPPRPQTGPARGGPGPKKRDPQVAKMMKLSEKRYGKTPQPEPSRGPSDRKGEVREFIKDPFGQPFLPGSSVKGCLRTALAWRLAQDSKGRPWVDKNADPRRQGSFSASVERLFGENPENRNRKDPTKDVLKAFVLRDSGPIDLEKHFAVTQVRVMNTFREDFKAKDTIPIFTESLMPGPEPIALPFYIDLFRLERDPDLRNASRGKTVELLKDPAQFASALRGFSNALIEHEAGFYLDRKQTQQANFLRGLAAGANAIHLDLGFATGWFAKTIGLCIDDSELQEIRDRVNERRPRAMGSSGVELFPKTRKWVKSKTGYVPMGWVKIEIEWT